MIALLRPATLRWCCANACLLARTHTNTHHFCTQPSDATDRQRKCALSHTAHAWLTPPYALRLSFLVAGNTCYINASVQALANCPPFSAVFVECLGYLTIPRPVLPVFTAEVSSPIASHLINITCNRRAQQHHRTNSDSRALRAGSRAGVSTYTHAVDTHTHTSTCAHTRAHSHTLCALRSPLAGTRATQLRKVIIRLQTEVEEPTWCSP